jgi:two-component system, chemotaxis family, chemotaxis protein CheY
VIDVALLETSVGRPGPILVIDDDDAVRTAIDVALSAEGYDVVTACDGIAGLEAAMTHFLALILLDLRMPGMDGPQFARAYSLFPGPHAPTVVVTAAENGASWARQIGAAAHLGKPFDLEDLLTIVERYAGPPERID